MGVVLRAGRQEVLISINLRHRSLRCFAPDLPCCAALPSFQQQTDHDERRQHFCYGRRRIYRYECRAQRWRRAVQRAACDRLAGWRRKRVARPASQCDRCIAGSHTVLTLLEHDFKVVILDNLDNSFQKAYDRMVELAGDNASNMKFIKAGFRARAAGRQRRYGRVGVPTAAPPFHRYTFCASRLAAGGPAERG